MSAYPRPIHCVDCEIDFKPEKNGIWLLETFTMDKIPYALWQADLWKCPKCGKEVISGYAEKSIKYHEHKDFPDLMKIAEKGKIYFNYQFTESKEEKENGITK